MKIYTKTGDKGTTALLGGARVPKSHIRIEAYGTVDELNSYIGLLRDQSVNNGRKDLLKTIQDRLFTLGAELATEPGKDKVVTEELTKLLGLIDVKLIDHLIVTKSLAHFFSFAHKGLLQAA